MGGTCTTVGCVRNGDVRGVHACMHACMSLCVCVNPFSNEGQKLSAALARTHLVG